MNVTPQALEERSKTLAWVAVQMLHRPDGEYVAAVAAGGEVADLRGEVVGQVADVLLAESARLSRLAEGDTLPAPLRVVPSSGASRPKRGGLAWGRRAREPRTVWVDVETLPPFEWELGFRGLLASMPRRIRRGDPAAGMKWLRDHPDAWRDLALDPRFGRLLCIGVAVDDDGPSTVLGYDDEAGGLRELVEYLGDHGVDDRAVWAGYRVPFDLRWLRARAAVHRLPGLAAQVPWRRYGRRVLDVHELWTCGERDARAGLDELAAALHLPGKPEGLSGDQVLDAFIQGRHEQIAAYCAHDVELARDVAVRLGAV